MNTRERFHAVMRFAKGVRTLRWEFGYWNAAIDRWYQEGLIVRLFFATSGAGGRWSALRRGLPYPYYIGLSRHRDIDVHNHFKLDDGAGNIPMNWRFYPPLREQILEEDGHTCTMINSDGATLKISKEKDTLPQYLAWPVSDRKSERIKEERYNLKDISRPSSRQW